jgi:hypothetical protein
MVLVAQANPPDLLSPRLLVLIKQRMQYRTG